VANRTQHTVLRTSSCFSSVARAALPLAVLLIGAAVGLAVGAFVAGVDTAAMENVLPAGHDAHHRSFVFIQAFSGL
jgi:hypothetical protein